MLCGDFMRLNADHIACFAGKFHADQMNRQTVGAVFVGIGFIKQLL